jgi:hypothetical protein
MYIQYLSSSSNKSLIYFIFYFLFVGEEFSRLMNHWCSLTGTLDACLLNYVLVLVLLLRSNTLCNNYTNINTENEEREFNIDL